MDSHCVFCRIVHGELDARIVYEDGDAVSILDLRQPRSGHTLVLPRVHVESIFDLTDAGGAALMRAVVAVSKAVRDAFCPEGLSLWQSNGPAAFQEVPHLHVHVLPRWTGDELLRIYPHRLAELAGADLDAQADAIRAALRP